MLHRISFLFALAAAPLVHAQALSPGDAALVQRAVSYLDGMTTASGRFVQTNARGQSSSGAFTLQRPGKARFDYDPPSAVTIASDGGRVVVVDRRLKTIQATPLGFTPLGLFLAKHIRLDKGVAVTRVEHAPGEFTVVATDAKHRNQGTIALEFAASPIALRGWTITQAGGGSTRVRLEGFAVSAPKPAEYFVLKDPKVGPRL